MTARDELAREIFITDNHHAKRIVMEAEWAERGRSQKYAYAIADGLIAAGYHRHRTITTVEELDALAFGSVVLDADGETYRSGISNGATAWWQAGPQGMFRTVALPATLIHDGGTS